MKHLVVIGLVLPEPASTAAGFRMMQILSLFKEWDYRISFLTAATDTGFSEKIDYQKIELNDAAFNHQLAELQPDIVLFDRFITEEQYGWRVSEACPDAIKILDTEDLHFLRAAREKAFKAKRNLEKADLINEVFKREFASIHRCDLSLIISEYEMQLLRNEFQVREEILFYLPFLYQKKAQKGPKFSQRKDFVSIGNFLHEPNWQAVLRLKKLWNSIKKQLPDSHLHIYGAYTPEKAWQLHNEKEGFLIKGRAHSVEEVFLNAKVLLASLPFGAGLKGKIFDSMQYGLPNVTNSTGAEGMHQNLPWNGIIADTEADFVHAAVRLSTEVEVWEKAQVNGFRILEKLFSEDLYKAPLRKKIEELSINLINHRNQNFLGQIFQHHLLQSTKYLSKWIEEKRKK